MLTVTLTAEDKIALLTGIGSNDVQLPRRVLTSTEWAGDFPPASEGLPVPYPYGSSSYVPPSPTNTGSVPAVPTGLTHTTHGSTGATTYTFTVTSYNAFGESAKSTPYAATDGNATITYSNYIQLTWGAVSGAIGYCVYLEADAGNKTAGFLDAGGYYTGLNPDVGHPNGQGGSLVLAGYLLTPDDDGDGSYPHVRPAVTVDTTTKVGPVVAVPVGQRTDANGEVWQAGVIAGCAISTVNDVAIDGVLVTAAQYGLDVLAPGQDGFTAAFGATTYVEVAGKRYTLIYLRNEAGIDFAAGTTQVSVYCDGIEATGNGSGTVITQLAAQYEHCLRNLVLRTYTTGNWATTGPTWEDTPIDVDLVDGASFDTVQAIWDARLPGTGCPGVWVLGQGETGQPEQQSVRTWLARLNQSLDVYCGFSRKSQFVVRAIDETADVSDTPQYSATLGIVADSFQIYDKTDQVENAITVQYHRVPDPNLDSVWTTHLHEDLDAQTAMGGEVKPYTLTLWAIDDPTVADEIGRRRLARMKYPYRVVRWTSDMGALSVDLGDTVRLTHPDGAANNGWTDRAVFITRHEFDPSRFTITLEGLDLDAIRATVDPPQSIPVSVSESVGASSDELARRLYPEWFAVDAS